MIPGIVAGLSVTPAPLTFAQTIAADVPYLWWRMGETSGSALADSSGNSRAGALFGTSGTDYARNEPGMVGDGSPSVELKTNAGYARTNTAMSASTLATNTTFMAVVRINNGASAGTIMGLHDGSSPTGTGGSRDRVLALDTSGKLRAAIWSGAISTITSAASINDGNPHILHLAIGANSGAGSALYIDGVSVGTVGAVSIDTSGTRHLYLGLLNMSGWGAGWGASATALGFYQDAAVFTSRLSAARILAHAQAAGLA